VEPCSAAKVPEAQGRQDDEPVSFANSPANKGFPENRSKSMIKRYQKCVYYQKVSGGILRTKENTCHMLCNCCMLFLVGGFNPSEKY